MIQSIPLDAFNLAPGACFTHPKLENEPVVALYVLRLVDEEVVSVTVRDENGTIDHAVLDFNDTVYLLGLVANVEDVTDFNYGGR